MGAIHIAGTWWATAPADEVWAVVEDLETWPHWWPAIRSIEPVGDGGRARLTFDTPRPLRPLVLEVAVTEREPPAHLVAEVTDGPMDGVATLDLADRDGATTIAFDLRLRVRSLVFRPVEGVLASAMRSGGRERLGKAGDDLARLAGGEPLEHEL